MNLYQLNQLNDRKIQDLCRRPKFDSETIETRVSPIIRDVREKGDEAVRLYTRKFEGCTMEELFLDPHNLDAGLPVAQQKAVDSAMQNIYRFHREQIRGDLQVETMPGVTCMKRFRPIERVGLYIPGGSAPLPSTAMMLGIPASIAGCKTIVIATPPDRQGNIPPSIVYVARKIGAAGILAAGGAQAVAAMAYGTETVPKTDKIFGPGNQYVTAAKMMLQNSDAMVSMDLPAGPSEVLVIADNGAEPSFVAADLLSQAEHGPDSQVVLIAVNGFDIQKLRQELTRLLEKLPRAVITKKALENSFILEAGNVDRAMDFSNRYAPEHLILNLENPEKWIDRVEHAGSVFLGRNTPESLGDYASGTNHTLPTYGYARMYSGVSLDSFQKSITFQTASEEGLQTIGPTVETLAEMEGLDAHKLAVSIRLKKLTI